MLASLKATRLRNALNDHVSYCSLSLHNVFTDALCSAYWPLKICQSYRSLNSHYGFSFTSTFMSLRKDCLMTNVSVLNNNKVMVVIVNDQSRLSQESSMTLKSDIHNMTFDPSTRECLLLTMTAVYIRSYCLAIRGIALCIEVLIRFLTLQASKRKVRARSKSIRGDCASLIRKIIKVIPKSVVRSEMCLLLKKSVVLTVRMVPNGGSQKLFSNF
ncbi:hypothetical protein EDC96DRAFT_546201 [Choanephora cucurbitarum]|nr:hypothetical protein EDC96DRAFT_546201 [Choanephora cucurbitarum]